MGKKRQKKAEQQQNPNIAEATRIQISQILEKFRAANDQGILAFSKKLFKLICVFFIEISDDFCFVLVISRNIFFCLLYMFLNERKEKKKMNGLLQLQFFCFLILMQALFSYMFCLVFDGTSLPI